MPSIASSDGVSVAYLRLAGSGAKLLMVHATGFCATIWRPVAEALSDVVDCWALDVRGHGATAPPADGSMKWAGTADDVLAVAGAIDASGEVPAGPWLGVGHSMGGASLVLAEQQRPGTFGALWVYEPVIFPPSFGEWAADGGGRQNPLADAALRRRATFPSAEAAFENYASKPPMNVFDHRALRGYLERGLVRDPSPDAPASGVRLACEPAIEAQLYRMGPQHSAWSHFDAVACPVTVVTGDQSVPGPAGFAASIAAELPGGELEVHDDLGHFGPAEAPDRMAESIRTAFHLPALSPHASTIRP